MIVKPLASEVVQWGHLVKFSHSIFALPFALSMMVVVWRDQPILPLQILWIVIAIVSARTAAMGFNRLVDASIDAKNPRTLNREIPRGAIQSNSVRILLLISSVTFLIASGLLGGHCLILAPFVLALLLFYSITKRFTRWSHLFLGAALACAPGGVWYALRGTFELLPLLLMIGVAFWVAGFDMLYACQDAEFDRAANLHSVAAKLGIRAALRLGLVFHLLTLIFFTLFGIYGELGAAYYIGLAAFAAVLLSQHLIVKEDDLSRIDAAFFTRNGIASVLFFLAVCLDAIILTS